MIYSEKKIRVLREGGRRLASVLQGVVALVRPGVTTQELDQYAERAIRAAGGRPSFLGYKGSLSDVGFSSSLCTSINSEVVHAPAVPSRVLKKGDIIGLDIGMRYPAKGGLCTDMAVTVGVGQIAKEAARLISVSREALDRGVAAAQVEARVRDISRAIQERVEAAGYSIVRSLVGHGVGRQVHEAPEVPNFVVAGPIGDYRLQPGLVIAIEPMINVGGFEVETQADHWTVATKDHSLSAHFEHTIVITARGPEVITQL